MKLFSSLFLFLCLSSFSACTFAPPKPPRTQLQIREMQTRSYDNKVGNFKRVMKAVINVLQDDGFIIKNADKELGFITAVKEYDVTNTWERGLSMTFGNNQSRYRNNVVMESSVNLTEVNKGVRVRALFQKKTLDNFGAAYGIEHVERPEFYQEFFSKVDKGLFLEEQGF